MKSKPNSTKNHGSELQLYRQCQPKLKAKQYFYGFLFVFRLSGSKDQKYVRAVTPVRWIVESGCKSDSNQGGLTDGCSVIYDCLLVRLLLLFNV